MKKVTLALILVFFLSGCASKPYGTSDPQDAIEQCAELSGIREKVRQFKKDASESGQSLEETLAPTFGPDGHTSATAVIARISGLSPERQYALSYYSNYPDIDSTYNAWKVSVYNTFLPWNWSWLCESNDTLHALHGGNDDEIKERRENLTSALKYTLQSDESDWISGILMHALADTFAHTKQGYSTEDEEAYGCYWGHVWDNLNGNNPDKIALKIITKEKFKEYIKLLFEILSEEGGGTSDGEEHLGKIKVEIDRMECNNNNCMDFHEAMVNVDFIDDENLKKYEKCMNSQSRQIAKSEMQNVMDFIKQGKAN